MTTNRLGQTEFIALMAMLFATIALSTDAMLPALPIIAEELTPGDVNKVHLVVSSFFFGMGFGTMIAGPVSDAFGRKPVILICAAIFIAGAGLCYLATSLQSLLLARVLMGIGAAAPRVVGMALVRDLYQGREMARIVSFVMMIFMTVPAIAPLAGQGLLLIGDWRMIFVAIACFGLVVNAWVMVRQPETLPVTARRPLRMGVLWQSTKEMSRHRLAVISTLCQSLGTACLLATISSQQAIFERTFDRASTFPMWFGVIALCAASGSLLNSRVVMKRGMQSVIAASYLVQVGFTATIVLLEVSGLMPPSLVFPAHILWSIGVVAMMGLTQGNLAALAMQDLGHLAGFAASMMTAISTILAVALAIPVGLAFNGSQFPLMVGIGVFASLALALIKTVNQQGA